MQKLQDPSTVVIAQVVNEKEGSLKNETSERIIASCAMGQGF
jgi:hypothetical protein